MGYDFVNSKDESFGLNSVMWDELRSLAIAFSWNPAGTYQLKDEDTFWETYEIDIGDPFGPYTGNSAQVVTTSDALELSQALERGLASSSYEKVVNELRRERIAFLKRLSTPKVRLKLSEVDLAQHKECVGELASYCKRGAFVII